MPDSGGDERSARRPDVIDAHVGARVRLRRTLMGISQEKLGEFLGLTFQQVQKYEKGTNRIGAGRLFSLSHILQVPVSFFYEGFSGDGAARPADVAGFAEKPSEGFMVEFLSTREGLELNKAFVRIKDAKARRAIVELARALAGEEE